MLCRWEGNLEIKDYLEVLVKVETLRNLCTGLFCFCGFFKQGKDFKLSCRDSTVEFLNLAAIQDVTC